MSLDAFLSRGEDNGPGNARGAGEGHADRRRRTRPGSWLLAGIPAALLVVLPWLDTAPGADAPGLALIPLAQAVVLPLCLVAIALALVFLLCRRVAAAAILAVAVVAAGAMGFVPAPAAEAKPGQPSGPDRNPVRVLSLNVQYGRADAAAVGRIVKEHEVKVLVLQEATEGFIAALLSDPEVRAALPRRTGTLPEVGADGTAILSAGQLREERAPWGNTGAHFEQRSAVITLPRLQPFRVVGVHLLPPTVSVGTWREELNTLGDVQRAATDLPLIVAGDFNAGYGSPGLRRAINGLSDAAREAGVLPQSTWPVSPAPLAPIDHVLSRRFAAQAWETVSVPGTDHRGILAGFYGEGTD